MTGKLSERAMLVSLSIGSWSGMLIDREVTDAVNQEYKAGKQAGRYNKRIVASEFLQGVSSAHSNARRIHKLLTLPWEDNGTRALCSKGYINYSKMMKDCRIKAEAEVKALKGQRDAIIREAKSRLGDMFDIDDYPTDEEIAEKFSFDVEIKPMPDAGDFRVQMSDDTLKSITKDIEKRSNARLEKAMNDVFARVADVIGRMSEKLREYQPAKDGNKAVGKIYDSVVYNIQELADMMPDLNITDDPRITALAQQLKDDLVEHSPEILKADTKARQSTITKADKLLKKVQSYIR